MSDNDKRSEYLKRLDEKADRLDVNAHTKEIIKSIVTDIYEYRGVYTETLTKQLENNANLDTGIPALYTFLARENPDKKIFQPVMELGCQIFEDGKCVIPVFLDCTYSRFFELTDNPEKRFIGSCGGEEFQYTLKSCEEIVKASEDIISEICRLYHRDKATLYSPYSHRFANIVFDLPELINNRQDLEHKLKSGVISLNTAQFGSDVGVITDKQLYWNVTYPDNYGFDKSFLVQGDTKLYDYKISQAMQRQGIFAYPDGVDKQTIVDFFIKDGAAVFRMNEPIADDELYEKIKLIKIAGDDEVRSALSAKKIKAFGCPGFDKLLMPLRVFTPADAEDVVSRFAMSDAVEINIVTAKEIKGAKEVTPYPLISNSSLLFNRSSRPELWLRFRFLPGFDRRDIFGEDYVNFVIGTLVLKYPEVLWRGVITQ